MHKPRNFLIAYGYVARSFISNMYFMSLFNQARYSPTHGNHVVVWVRRKNYYSFRIWQFACRPHKVSGTRLSAGPSCNSMLQGIECLYVQIICRAIIICKQFQSGILVIATGKFQNRLVKFSRKPYHGRKHKPVCPKRGIVRQHAVEFWCQLYVVSQMQIHNFKIFPIV